MVLQNLQLPSLSGIHEAMGQIRPYLPETPLVRSEMLSQAMEADVWLKNETVSPIASFKLRGALNAILQARKTWPIQGVITSSTGNHGQGVAYAGRLLGLPAHIFLPEVANPVKRKMIEAFGATIHQVGEDLDAAKDVAKRYAQEHSLLFVDDGENLDLIQGAGTVGLEVAEALTDIDWLVMPMGSGSFASGCSAAIKSLQPNARTIAVQSTGSPAMVESFLARKPVERPIDTIADGIVCRVPADLALAGLFAYLDDAWLVTDQMLLSAIHTLAESAHVLVEPSGAAAVAGAWQNREQLKGSRVVLVLTGANITMPYLRQALLETPFFDLAT